MHLERSPRACCVSIFLNRGMMTAVRITDVPSR